MIGEVVGRMSEVTSPTSEMPVQRYGCPKFAKKGRVRGRTVCEIKLVAHTGQGLWITWHKGTRVPHEGSCPNNIMVPSLVKPDSKMNWQNELTCINELTYIPNSGSFFWIHPPNCDSLQPITCSQDQQFGFNRNIGNVDLEIIYVHHSCWRAANGNKSPFLGGLLSKRPRAYPGMPPVSLIKYFSVVADSISKKLKEQALLPIETLAWLHTIIKKNHILFSKSFELPRWMCLWHENVFSLLAQRRRLKKPSVWPRAISMTIWSFVSIWGNDGVRGTGHPTNGSTTRRTTGYHRHEQRSWHMSTKITTLLGISRTKMMQRSKRLNLWPATWWAVLTGQWQWMTRRQLLCEVTLELATEIVYKTPRVVMVSSVCDCTRFCDAIVLWFCLLMFCSDSVRVPAYSPNQLSWQRCRPCRACRP